MRIKRGGVISPSMESPLIALNAEIAEVRAAIARRKKMKTHLKRIRSELTYRRRQLATLTSSLRKEKRDVNKLEHLTVRTLFKSILGNLEEQLQIERQEYLTAVLKYNECVDIVDALEYELRIINEKLEELPVLQKQWEKLLTQKLTILKRTDSATAARLKALDVSEHSLNITRIEIDEAINAGVVAKRYLRSLVIQLKKVKDWGSREMYGQGRYSSYAKKSYIDKARKTSLNVKMALDKFELEVQDVFRRQRFQDKFDIGRFEGFLDKFYDNLITDWVVQKSTSHVLSNVESISDKVLRILSMLKIEHTKVKREISALEKRRKKIILSC